MRNIIDPLAPCGVFCEACPSFEKTCLGCPSNDKNQKRISKWRCKIRICCYEKKQIDFCAFCEDFPCKEFNKRLLKPHPKDERYKYRHELKQVAKRLIDLGVDDYYYWLDRKWSCTHCGGRVYMYEYVCSECGKYLLV